MSFKITIINNENGDVLVNEENAVEIIGEVKNKEETACLGFTSCNGIQLLEVVEGNDKAKREILNNSPHIKLMYDLKAMMDK